MTLDECISITPDTVLCIRWDRKLPMSLKLDQDRRRTYL